MTEKNPKPARFGPALTLIIIFLLCPKVYALSASTAPAGTYIPRLERILKQNIVPFWYDKSLDRVNGGYIINFGPKGELKAPGAKMIVTQARTVWLFCRLARAGYDGKKALDAAELGFDFLRDKMWDAKNGGFFWGGAVPR